MKIEKISLEKLNPAKYNPRVELQKKERKKKKEEIVPAAAKEEEIPDRQEFVAAVSAAIAEELGTDVSAIRILSIKRM